MTSKKLSKWADELEQQACEQLLRGFPQREKKKSLIQEIAYNLLLENFPQKGSLHGEGIFIARHVLVGGLAAAEKLDYSSGKIARQMCIGLLKAICEKERDFIRSADLITRAAVQAALLVDYDVCRMTEEVVGAVLKVGQSKVFDSEELVKKVARAAVSVAGSFSTKDSGSLRGLLMALLEGKVCLPEDDPES